MHPEISEASHHNNLKHQSTLAFPPRNSKMLNAFLIGAFLAGAFVGCESIFCYICSSITDPDCKTPEKLQRLECGVQAMKLTKEYAEVIDSSFSSIFDVDVDNGHTAKLPFNCLKQVIKDGKEETVLRGCQLAADANKLDVCKKVLKMEYTNKLQVTHCTLCGDDECNVAIRNVFDVKLLLAIAIFKLIF